MGAFFSKLFDSIFSKRDVRILLLGLAAAGKTTILYNFKLGEVVASVPTVGFNVESVEYKNIKFTMWDIGGQDVIRPLWRYYYSNTEGLIYVVDSSDSEQIDLAKEELWKMLDEYELKDASLLILANKQDKAVMTVSEMAEKLGLNNLRGREWKIQGTCALTSSGLYEGLDWLCKQMSKKSKA